MSALRVCILNLRMCSWPSRVLRSAVNRKLIVVAVGSLYVCPRDNARAHVHLHAHCPRDIARAHVHSHVPTQGLRSTKLNAPHPSFSTPAQTASPSTSAKQLPDGKAVAPGGQPSQNLAAAISADCTTTTTARPGPTHSGSKPGVVTTTTTTDGDDVADEADSEDLFALYGVPHRMGSVSGLSESEAASESELSAQEQKDEPFAPTVLLTREEKNRIAEHLQVGRVRACVRAWLFFLPFFFLPFSMPFPSPRAHTLMVASVPCACTSFLSLRMHSSCCDIHRASRFKAACAPCTPSHTFKRALFTSLSPANISRGTVFSGVPHSSSPLSQPTYSSPTLLQTHTPQDVISDYQAEYLDYMKDHHYAKVPAEAEGTDEALLYREPLPTPHALECRAHEPGLVKVGGGGKKGGGGGGESTTDRLYCFGGSSLAGPRVCDVEHNDYTRLRDTAKGYDTYELYGKNFAFRPFYRTSMWTANAKKTTTDSTGAERALVTAMSQGSWNRLDHLAKLVKVWQGPVAFALLLDSEDQLPELDAVFAGSEEMRKHVDLHVAWRVNHAAEDADAFYPINMLRNMALQPISSGYAFVIDVDNIPNAKMSKYRAWVERAELAVRNASEHQVCPGLHAFVPPAVEMTAERLERMYRANEKAGAPPLTLSKSKLVEGFYDGTVLPMHMYFGPAYVPTNHFEWGSSPTVDRLNYLTRFEPYYIARVPVPLFNESFVNRGGNYAQQVYEMHAAGYEFYRMPKAFVVDIPHERAGAATPSAAHVGSNGTAAGEHHQQPQNSNGKGGKAGIVKENRTKQAVHNEDFIANLWVTFSDWVSHRYGHNMPSPRVVDVAFRRYRRAQDKVVNAMFRLLATKESKDGRASRKRALF